MPAFGQRHCQVAGARPEIHDPTAGPSRQHGQLLDHRFRIPRPVPIGPRNPVEDPSLLLVDGNRAAAHEPLKVSIAHRVAASEGTPRWNRGPDSPPGVDHVPTPITRYNLPVPELMPQP